MKEGMISFMAQLMGNGQSKDNFFLRTRSALQDTLALFFIAKNISMNNSIQFYLPRLIEMISDLIDVERCSIFLYDRQTDELYLKVITGRLKDQISFKRQSNNILCQAFHSGQSQHLKNLASQEFRNVLGDYQIIDQKLHSLTRNLLIVPIKLGCNVVGCLEVANKKSQQDFTDNDIQILEELCNEIASGLISYEMKANIKREQDQEIKHVKGLMNESYNSFLIPMVNSMTTMLRTFLKAEKVITFMHNREIDHLYSLSESSLHGQFGIDTIRMKSNLGLAGKAFTSKQISIEYARSQQSVLISEEKDLQKLKIKHLHNVLSIPILDKQNDQSIAVVQVYNFNESQTLDQECLSSIGQLLSSILFKVDTLQGILLTNDVLESSFNLINDAVVILNASLNVTKINKSAQILFNASSEIVIGKQLSELLSVHNNHLFSAFQSVLLDKQHTCLQMVQFNIIRARDSSQDDKSISISVNFYANRLNNENNRAHGYCVVIQPIVILK